MNAWSSAVVVAWLSSFALDWPRLPLGTRVSEVLFLPAALMVLRAGGLSLRIAPVDAAVGAYLLGSAVGFIASADRTASGVEFARHAYLAGIYGVVALGVARGFGAAVTRGLTLMSLLPACIGVLFAATFLLAPFQAPAIGELMTVPYAGDVLRLLALTASPTMFACALTVSLAFAVARCQAAQGTRQRLWIAAVTVMLIALAMTFSHAWAGAALAITIVLWPHLSRIRYARTSAVATVVALTVTFNVSLVASIQSPGLSYAVDRGRVTVGGSTVEYSVMSYFRIKQIAWEAFLAQPLTGVGLDRFHELTRAAYEQGRLPHLYREIDPHSSVLGRLAETGLVGGVTLLALWTTTLAAGRRLTRSAAEWQWMARAGCAAIAGLLLAGVNVDIMNFRFLWAAMGVLRGLDELRSTAAAA